MYVCIYIMLKRSMFDKWLDITRLLEYFRDRQHQYSAVHVQNLKIGKSYTRSIPGVSCIQVSGQEYNNSQRYTKIAIGRFKKIELILTPTLTLRS